jgi:hypothetical protein
VRLRKRIGVGKKNDCYWGLRLGEECLSFWLVIFFLINCALTYAPPTVSCHTTLGSAIQPRHAFVLARVILPQLALVPVLATVPIITLAHSFTITKHRTEHIFLLLVLWHIPMIIISHMNLLIKGIITSIYGLVEP